MRRLMVIGLTGWTSTVAVTWWLADRRLVQFNEELQMACDPKFTAQRDAIVTYGMAVALVFVLVMEWLDLRQRRSLRDPEPRAAKPVEPTLLP